MCASIHRRFFFFFYFILFVGQREEQKAKQLQHREIRPAISGRGCSSSKPFLETRWHSLHSLPIYLHPTVHSVSLSLSHARTHFSYLLFRCVECRKKAKRKFVECAMCVSAIYKLYVGVKTKRKRRWKINSFFSFCILLETNSAHAAT